MSRVRASLTSDAIRIEDEVWQEAFATRVPSSRRSGSTVRGDFDRRPVAARPAAARPIGALPVAAERPLVSARLAEEARLTEEARLAEDLWVAERPTASVTAARRPRVVAAPSTPTRRTVTITGRGAERHLPWPGETQRRRPARAAYERHGFKPDRMAMWAMVLGLLLVLIAVISAHG